MNHTKHFTLEEARDVLSEIKPMIEEMIRLKKTLDEKGYDIYRHQYFGGAGPNGTGKFPAELNGLILIIESISNKGVLIKGLDKGLLDFPYIRNNGEEVYLCWIYGEDDILYWHRIEDGFSGRKRIDEL